MVINWDSRGSAPRSGNAVFDALFQHVTQMAAQTMRQQGLLKGEDYESQLFLSIEEAQKGAHKKVKLAKSRPEIEVSVPAGMRDGSRLRLRGQGGYGNPPGDGYVTVKIDLPLGVALVGNELHTEIAVTGGEADKGTTTSLFGHSLNIPPKSKDGDTLKIPSAGLAGADMIVTLRVAPMQAWWRKARALIGV
ncbi:MAG: DnaJ C-terminal domain-containing protein [Deinococcales bacterium]